ncbi:DUF5011 domain-containing protein [Listeria booriae]|uniref:immunoglobulin-like domain-containing protein n=1 Tax=Listeria booriae TaxID=1552123 RepID=UPI001626522E|nr:immunoglobulin-like domain-containing protein [Listeria booriae]MBC2080873.1 DUF5011 domain-containing protein [Listeria booriae]
MSEQEEPKGKKKIIWTGVASALVVIVGVSGFYFWNMDSAGVTKPKEDTKVTHQAEGKKKKNDDPLVAVTGDTDPSDAATSFITGSGVKQANIVASVDDPLDRLLNKSSLALASDDRVDANVMGIVKDSIRPTAVVSLQQVSNKDEVPTTENNTVIEPEAPESVDPIPEPQPEPTPLPEPEPQPQPNPEPTPNPQPEPEPNPEPTPEPKPEPEPQPEPENQAPVLHVLGDRSIAINHTFNPMEGVSAVDAEDGDLTTAVRITFNDVDMSKAGLYHIVYEVTDSKGSSTTVEVAVVVTAYPPEIKAENQVIPVNGVFDPLANVTATDAEDGDITASVQVIANDVNTAVAGEYHVTYEVIDSSQIRSEKTITIIVEDQVPTLNAEDRVLTLNSVFDVLEGVFATDPEDGALEVTILENTVDTTTVGEYSVVYQVTDSFGHIVTKTITVQIVE